MSIQSSECSAPPNESMKPNSPRREVLSHIDQISQGIFQVLKNNNPSELRDWLAGKEVIPVVRSLAFCEAYKKDNWELVDVLLENGPISKHYLHLAIVRAEEKGLIDYVKKLQQYLEVLET